MGEPVPRFPPSVAPLRISRDANCGHSWSSSGTRPSSSRSASDRVSAAPISMLVSPDGERAQLGQPVDGHHERGAGAAQVDLDAPVRAAGDHRGVGPVGQQRQRRPEVRRADELGVAGADARGHDRRCGRRCTGPRSRRPGAGAPSAYAASRIGRYPVQRHRFPLSACRSKPLGPCSRSPPWPLVDGSARCAVRPVELGGHAADEARRAVAALRPAADGHLALHRVQGARLAEALGGDDLLAVEREHRHEAGVQRGPAGAARTVRQSAVRSVLGPGDQHRAGAALALGAALLGAGQTLVAQPVQRGDVRLRHR